jgi:peptidoglycan L-alanyl-D-glutamate endopeptidase CwlK
MTKLNATSLTRLRGVDADLVALAKKAREISPIPFEITEGLRTAERQRYLVKTGKSRTLKSYHLRGKALDFVAMPGGKVSWDLKDYKTIVEKAFKPAAKSLGLADKITYGIYWKSIVDGPHVQIETP